MKVSVKDISISRRDTQGSKIIKLSDDDKVLSAMKIDDNLE